MSDELDDQASRSLEDYWAIARRRRWWMLLPLFFCWVAVWGVSWILPATYQSQALILVEQQKVPERYVTPNVTLSLQDRLQSMTQQILSRTRLQTTIDRFHLYPFRRGLTGLTQSRDPVEQMRGDIKIDLVESTNKTGGRPGELAGFKISYSAGSAEVAQQVNSELTSLFIDDNLKSQQRLSESTTAFLQSELADARAKLEEQETKVRAFKTKHIGDLPSQLLTNVQVLSGLQAQLQNTQRGLDSAKQQKLYLESLLQQYQSLQTVLRSGDPTATSPDALDKELLDLRLRLADARSRYTEDYPEVIALKDSFAKTEKLEKEIQNEIVSNQMPGKATNTVEAGAARQVQAGSTSPSTIPMIQIQSQLQANELEVQNYQQHEKELESQISSYQARLNMTPETEQELADISRGYEESKSNYDSLLQKQNQSLLATSLEHRQQGEQFRILDPPSLPDKPSAPNHFLVSLGGLALGITVGLGLTALLELTEVRVRQERDLEGLVPARILVGIPHLSTPREDHLRVMASWMELTVAVAMVMLIVAGNLFAFLKG